jgi:transcriptional regulator with XRE-family HTH domain
MGVARRMPVKGLGRKLKQIRLALGLSQEKMLDHLAQYDRRIKTLKKPKLNKSNISQYENGRLEPPIPVLWAYAQSAGVCPGVLMDPKKKLPLKLPVVPGHQEEG